MTRIKTRLMALTCAVAAALALTACDLTGNEPDPSSAGSPTDQVATTETDQSGPTTTLINGQALIDVHSLVRSGDYVVLTLDLTGLITVGSADHLECPASECSGLFGSFDYSAEAKNLTYKYGGAIRLVDLADGQVYRAAEDSEGLTVSEGADCGNWGAASGSCGFLTNGGVGRIQIAYQAPPTDSIGLLIRGNYLPDTPITTGEGPGPLAAGQATPTFPAEPLDLSSITRAPVLGIQSLTAQLGGTVETRQTTEAITITLGADVLFGKDSAALTADAESAIAAAAAEIQTHAPGTVDVVGYTDDLGSAEHGLELSQQRAQAVADALGNHLDTSQYVLKPSGKGEEDPAYPNTSEENRVKNRRVELTLHSAKVTETDVTIAPSSDTEPDTASDIVNGPEGYTFNADDPSYPTCKLSFVSALRVDGSLVVTAESEMIDPAGDIMMCFNFATGASSFRGEGTAQGSVYTFTPAILMGSTAVYPSDYLIGTSAEGAEMWEPLTDLDANGSEDTNDYLTYATGQTVQYVAIFDDVADADTITIQQMGYFGAGDGVRFTDIPVLG
jgi:outer membrane protein OmpA-like peptidoglycan-associated protein